MKLFDILHEHTSNFQDQVIELVEIRQKLSPFINRIDLMLENFNLTRVTLLWDFELCTIFWTFWSVRPIYFSLCMCLHWIQFQFDVWRVSTWYVNWVLYLFTADADNIQAVQDVKPKLEMKFENVGGRSHHTRWRKFLADLPSVQFHAYLPTPATTHTQLNSVDTQWRRD